MREERREEREERREKSAERSEKREERRDHKKGSQRSSNEAFWTTATDRQGLLGGSNLCILKMNRGCVAKIHCAYAATKAWPSPSPPTGWKKTERRERR